MTINITKEILAGSETAFLNSATNSNLAYRPRFISNDATKGEKVLTSIENELKNCDSFIISVAFITEGGIKPLLQTLRELEHKKIPGKILTTDYNMFTDPKALDKLAGLSNLEVRMYQEDGSEKATDWIDPNQTRKADTEKVGFHTKGYIFRKDETFTIIMGSSNMTMRALTINKEWNTRVVSTANGEYIQDLNQEFDLLWDDPKHTRKYDDFIEEYRTRYVAIKKQRKVALSQGAVDPEGTPYQVISMEQYKLQPNKMQVGFINSLKRLKEAGENKALLVSATGTGKTYASAFGVRDALMADGKHGKVLFIVHRKQILRQALESYRNVFGKRYQMAMLTGTDQDFALIDQADFLFAMVTMVHKEEIMKRFPKDTFSVIVIDEVHHASSMMYQKVIQYFKPSFLLGMTATPDRTDNENIYEIFDNNIAYEIRLQQALEHDLLCPFHYFGITDISFSGIEIDDDFIKRAERDDYTLFNLLTSDERVDYIIEQAEYYGYDGDRVKGLMFCSSVKEAYRLSEKLNERGYRTVALSGNDDDATREEAMDRLVSDTRKDVLDYILTVNIFNEGVDLPEINQVIMLRPTESSIVFIQQLGRGLRKLEGKEYVVVLDFIGNYNNNFLIPVALSGDRTYNKDNMRKYLMEGSNIIPGCSSIHFDEISKKKIFESIDHASTPLKFLKEKYMNLKNKLGRVPTLVEMYRYGEVDPILFIDYAKGAYNLFVKKADRDSGWAEFNKEEQDILDFISLNLANGKRVHELLMLDFLCSTGRFTEELFREKLEEYGIVFRKKDYTSALNVLRVKFTNSPSEKTRYKNVRIIRSTGSIGEVRGSEILFKGRKAFRKALKDVIEYSLERFQDYYSAVDEDNLVLYQKYSRKDVCRILNWEKDDSNTVYGYRYKFGTCPIFVTYEKKENISESTKYEDQFVDNTLFSWMTRSKVKLQSPESQAIIHSTENNERIYLFIKKSDGEGSDFYYMGRVFPVAWSETTIKNDKGQDLPIMNFKMKMFHPVRNDIYEYLTE